MMRGRKPFVFNLNTKKGREQFERFKNMPKTDLTEITKRADAALERMKHSK